MPHKLLHKMTGAYSTGSDKFRLQHFLTWMDYPLPRMQIVLRYYGLQISAGQFKIQIIYFQYLSLLHKSVSITT